MSALLVDCASCDGTGVKLAGEGCGGPCAQCAGLGIYQKPVTQEQFEEVFYGDLPAGWTKEHARALLSRIKTGAPVVMPENIWSPYPVGRP